MITLSRKPKLRTIKHIQTQTVESLSSALIKVLKMDTQGGFIVNLVLIDYKFAKFESTLDLVENNTTAAQEHVGKIK